MKRYRKSLLVKVGITFVVVLVISSVQLFQRYTWTEITGRTLGVNELVLLFLGYGIFTVLSIAIYVFHKRYPFDRHQLVKVFLVHAIASLVFSLIHNLLFSVVYYVVNPIWQDYSFLLLYQDVLLNFLNSGLIFYWIAIIFSEAYDRFVKTEFSGETILVVRDQGKTHLLQMNDIQYLLSADNYVKVIARDKMVVTRESMTSLERKLDPSSFLRIHRSAVVNRSFISEINRTATGEINLVMKDSTVLPMSRRRKEAKALLATQLN